MNYCPRCLAGVTQSTNISGFQHCARDPDCFIFNERIRAFSIYDDSIEYRIVISKLEPEFTDIYRFGKDPDHIAKLDFAIPLILTIEEFKTILAFS